jgi:hypothetical protein
MATGGIEEGNPPFEAGTAKNEMGLPAHHQLEEGRRAASK